MNKFKKALVEMKLSQWIISTMWAMTFIMLLAFVGVVSGLTKQANKHNQQHWKYELTDTYQKNNSGEINSKKPIGIEINQQTKDYNFTKEKPGLSANELKQISDAKVVYDKEFKAAGKDDQKIQAAKLKWKPFAIMAAIPSNKDLNGTFHKVQNVEDIYSKELATALAIGTDNTPKELSTLEYGLEAKNAATAIAASGLTFFSLLTIAIFGTAIIKFKEKQGGK